MGPRTIRKKLEEEHSVTLSTSTIWRVIDRNRFFFADTMSHRARREDREREDDKNENLGSGLGRIAATIVLALAVWSGLFGANMANAAESASFQLSAEFPAPSTTTTQTSTNFQLDGNLTWNDTSLEGTSTTISGTPSTTVVSQSTDSTSSAEESPASHRGGARAETVARRNAEIGGKDVVTGVPQSQDSALVTGDHPQETAEEASDTSKSSSIHPREEDAVHTSPSPLVFKKTGEELFPSFQFVQAGEPTVTVHFAPTEKPTTHKGLLLLLLLGFGSIGIGLGKKKIYFARIAPLFRWTSVSRSKSGNEGSAYGFLFFLPIVRVEKNRRNDHEEVPRRRKKRNAEYNYYVRIPVGHQTLLWVAFAIITVVLAFFWIIPGVFAAETMAHRHTYNGYLFDSSGDAITTAHTIRFSYWTSSDHVSGNTTSTGAIHTSASTYGGWQEVHTVTPGSDGSFSVELGSGTALPSLSSLPATFYLQVEVKAASAANTAYELLDTDTTNATVDRSTVLPVPSALNADTVDHRDVGTASGSIPVLQTGAVFDTAHIPGGTESGTFVMDVDNSATGDITLQFGGTLAEKLTFSQSNSWFNFTDDVRIQGNLTVTGLVNGIDIDTLTSGTGSLKVASGGGLTVAVNEGSYRISGDTTNYAGSGSVGLSANQTNYLFFTSTGLLVNTIGFPSNHSYIPLAQITTSTGSVTSVTDRRVLLSDDREQTIEKVYHAEFEHVAYQGDATSNVGQLYVDHDATNDRNFYRWTTTATSIQDYDIMLRSTLPQDFTHWNTGSGNSIRVTYRTTSADVTDNQLDVSVFDTNGSPVTLSGSTVDLVNTSWTTTQIEFTGSPTWRAGGEFLIQFKMHASGSTQMQLGDVKFKYIELPSE